MKKETKLLLEKAIDSLILSIEHFNGPWDRGRVEAVLILLDHSFELLLKAAILHKGGKIRKKRENQTIGFEDCVRAALPYKIITEEQALTLRTINSLRDAAQHYLVELSEQHLYLQSQTGLTLFRDILGDIFQKDLAEELPKRVLPLSTTPPLDIAALFENELEEIRKLLLPKTRHRTEAIAKLRGLAIFDGAVRGETLQPSQSNLNKLADQVKQQKEWQEIFPGAASINLTSDGTGYNLSVRITKKEGIPVHLVPEGTPEATVVAIKRVNELDFYNLSHTQLAKNVGLTSPKTTALVRYLKLKEDNKYFKQITIGKSKFGRYSQEAIHKIKEELPKIDIDEIWQEYRHRMEKVNDTHNNRIAHRRSCT
jgi:hypothetical protein